MSKVGNENQLLLSDNIAHNNLKLMQINETLIS